jgi:hypothetical protein
VAYWIKIKYERNHYVIDLDRIATFCLAPNGKISFPLPDSDITVTLMQQNDPESYQAVMDFIEKRTGHSLP